MIVNRKGAFKMETFKDFTTNNNKKANIHVFCFGSYVGFMNTLHPPPAIKSIATRSKILTVCPILREVCSNSRSV